MTKTISVKELRMKFPSIRKKLLRGEGFTIIYRSKPIAQLTPMPAQFGNKLRERDYDFPKNMDEFLENVGKYALKSGKQFDVVKELRKDRGYDD